VTKFKLLALSLASFCTVVASASDSIAADKPKTAAPAVPKQLDVWKLEQTAEWVGDNKVSLNEHAFKFDVSKAGYVITMSAPEWKPVYYSDIQRTYFPETQEALKRSFAGRAAILRSQWMPTDYVCQKGKPGNVLGYATTTFILKFKHPGEHAFQQSELSFFDAVVAPTTANAIFGHLSGNISDHMPARIITRDNLGRISVHFNTKSIAKTKVASDWFNVPKGYKLARSEFDITADSGLVNDMVDDLGRQSK
jgi:hypothetical protein